MSRDMLLGVTLAASAAVTVGAGAMYIAYDLLKKGQDSHKSYIDSCLTSCTCKQEHSQRYHCCQQQFIPCKRHDQELLHEVSKVISNCDFMWGLGNSITLFLNNIYPIRLSEIIG